MKHAATKEKPSFEVAKIERTISKKKEKKVGEATILPFKKTKAKAAKIVELIAKETKAGKKSAKAAVSESKLKTAKASPLAGGVADKKIKKKETAAPVAVEKTSAKKEKKSAPVAAAKAKIERKKPKPEIVVKENKSTKKPTASAKTVQKIEPQINNFEAVASPVKLSSDVHKIKSAVNIGRINAALKAIEAAQIRAANVKESDRKKLKAAARKSKIAAQTVEATVASAKSKPKVVKLIGAAVFRGRKARYDFQVYPLDFEFENVPAIYVISKRKIDHKKRGHHALVCIGQTDSISTELKKHTQGRCVKKHEANAVSILPEPSEKKRLKIEEDLRAAHAIACNLAVE